MAEKHDSLADKIALFRSIDALKDDSADDDFAEDERTYRSHSKAFRGGASSSPVEVQDRPCDPAEQLGPPPSLQQSVPSTSHRSAGEQERAGPSQTTKRKLTDSPEPRSSAPIHLPSKVPRQDSLSAEPSSSGAERRRRGGTARGSSRRGKYDIQVEDVPLGDQIFRGIRLYYIRDSIFNPLRRLRIGRAVSHGAAWVRNVNEAEWVIVDEDLKWSDIEKVVESAKQKPLVLDCRYPLDCIQFKKILDPHQAKYRVSGFPSSPTSSPKAATPEPSRVAEDQDESNLQGTKMILKPRNTSHHPVATPPRSAEERPEGYQRESRDDNLETENARLSASGTDGQEASEKSDELSQCIEMLQKFGGVPIDVDDGGEGDVDSVAATEDGNNSSDDSSPRRSARTGQTRSDDSSAISKYKQVRFEDKFAASRGGTIDSSSAGPNARTIEILQAMCDYYDRMKDEWRTLAYRRAINTLKRQTKKISTRREAEKLPNVGSRLALKIEEIVTTDRLQRLEHAQENPTDQVLQMFLKIYGVGFSQASRWVAQGHRTLADLKERVNLNEGQIIGIDHFDDLNTRIPRSEVEALGVAVRSLAARIDPEVELIIGGSYRRGAPTCGDIDFVVTKKGTSSTGSLHAFLEDLIRVLETQGIAVATLASSLGKDRDTGSKWHGCIVLPNSGPSPVWRRADFLLVPESEIGAALLYFTGNDIFNRSMRLLASKKGMRLNQRGLYKDVMRGPGRAKVTEGGLVEGRDEKRIFEILGVQWREPHERWC